MGVTRSVQLSNGGRLLTVTSSGTSLSLKTVVVRRTGVLVEPGGSATQLSVRPSVSSGDSKRLTQCTAMGLMITSVESVSVTTFVPLFPVTVTMSVKFVQSVTRGMMHEYSLVSPAGMVVGKVQLERSSLLVTTMLLTLTGVGVPSAQTALTVILKQKAEHCDPDSFLMPHALVWSFRFVPNGSQVWSGFTHTTSS